MATPTSSSNRSKRKTNKPVTTSKGRQNRSSVSTAKVTNSEGRGSNQGSAKVTTGKGNTPKALPPGAKGGPLATQGRGSLKGQPQLLPGRKGGPVEKAGPTVDVKANTAKLKSGPAPKPSARPSLPPGRTGGSLARTSGTGAVARAANATRAAANAVSKSGRGAGRFLGPIGTALAIVDTAKAVANPRDNILTRGAALGRSIERAVGSGGGVNMTPEQRKALLNAKPTRPPLSSTGVRTKNGNTVPTGSPEYNRYRQQQLDDNKRRNALVRDTTPTRNNSSSAPSSVGGGGGSSQSYGRGSAPSAPSMRNTTPSTPDQRSPGYRTNSSGFYRGSDDYEKRLGEKNQKQYGDSSTSGNPLLDKTRRDMGRDMKTGERNATTSTAPKSSSNTGPAKPAQPAAPNSKKDGKSASATYENNRKSIENDPKATKVDISKMDSKREAKNPTTNSLQDALSNRKKRNQNTVAARVAQLRNGRMA